MKDRIRIVTACGVGMGSSLILKMMIEDLLKELDINAQVENTDIGSIKSTNADIVVVQTFHKDKMENIAKVVITIDNFFDKEKLREKLIEGLDKVKEVQN
ncbi:PTS sugar transporter subunit IIB [Thermoanaerobacter brockii subsp. lactiethylicus]|jgi:PTS system ascorbate-specific IIB component|uniref:Phosphotransferase system, lactose/cellobiose-specific IIB subunit n=2 Tax=Thermoanaerobacter TaxID=1754 RepID=B0KD88_THEP3|nr:MULTISPECIES: PTS sugar transporter subunit IIB [Thermoanaerobacter]KUJ90022.1 MAG: phosphotransferase system, lactose/cellobiose-specific IIB subunit [Thermoanaerobacter thermocopriae]ABY95607.1 phosphotransferase system, lactose/cellobiose-specific IIB subunit [Thermoanaerobacter pseudethanolicus ATCC 33223]ADV80545.1 phosphotransferase system lactose/cellobiose-specific IIB subunit [Thermoanaerobacter brockii subsp. finnii Ako-1]MDI3529657.1 ascorbate system component [Thermoanaerobacter 